MRIIRGCPAVPFYEPPHMIDALVTDEYEASKRSVRCHPGPVSIPAVEHGQDDAEPDPIERDFGPWRARVADEEEERWRGKMADDAPPAGVFHEEISEMPDRDEDDRGCLQPVGIVHRGRHALRPRRIVDVERIASVFLVPRHGSASKKKIPPRWITEARDRDRRRLGLERNQRAQTHARRRCSTTVT